MELFYGLELLLGECESTISFFSFADVLRERRVAPGPMMHDMKARFSRSQLGGRILDPAFPDTDNLADFQCDAKELPAMDYLDDLL